MAISTTLTTAPSAPSRSDPDNFRSEADAYVDWQANDFVGEMNTIIPEINAISTQANLDAATATNAAETAQASANFLGEWDDLSAVAATVPSSVAHDSYTWILLADMANVKSEEPSESATNWQLNRNNFMPRSERTTVTALASSDHGNLIMLTGTLTQTIAPISTLLSGWYCIVKNEGTGVITLDPNGSETIDGETTVDIQNGETRIIQANGTNFKSIFIASNLALIESRDVSAASSIEFTDLDGSYSSYIIKSDDFFTSSSAALGIQVGTGSTPTWQTGSTYSNISMRADSNDSALTVTSNETATQISTATSFGPASGSAFNSIEIEVINPSSSVSSPINCKTVNTYGSRPIETRSNFGVFPTTTPITAIRIIHATYTITGTFRIYGVN